AVAPHEAPRTCRWAGGTLIVGPRPHSGVAAPAGGADPLPVRPVRCRTDGATSWRTIRYAYVSLRRRQHAGLGTSARDRKSTRLNSSHVKISYAVFCLK